MEAGKFSRSKMNHDNDNIDLAIAMTGQLDYCDNKLTELIGHISRDYTIGETERVIKNRAGNVGTVVYVLKVQSPTDKLAGYVFSIVTKRTDVTVAEMRNFKIKLRQIVRARDIVAFILRYRYNMGFDKIARILGTKCHATIIKACQKFDTTEIDKIKLCDGDMLFVSAKRRYVRQRRMKSCRCGRKVSV